MPEQEQHHLVDEFRALKNEVSHLNSHRFVRLHNSIPRLLLFQFMRGVAFGFGTAVGATMLVSIAVLFLTTIDFIPVVGNWAAEIADMIEEPRQD